SDAAEIREAVKKVIANNAKAVSDYKAGKQQALTFITGQVMRATRGRANPSLAREILIEELGGK
ncbi:MAG: Asp-tRNA(Asn)/Glu-tRNA(Gln) amidotransferase GatCAB subunit B, partial [Dehalococcoidia bacterium]